MVVLVVEDSPTMRQLICHALRRITGIVLVEAADGKDALTKLDLRIVAPPSVQVTATGDQHDYTGTTQTRRYLRRRTRQVS